MGAVITAVLNPGEVDDVDDRWRPAPADDPDERSVVDHSRVLVVEDEHIVRTWIARLLEEAGHSVSVAVNGTEALRLSTGQSRAFDLLITDVRMPGLDGWELGRLLTERWPDLPVLYISGYDLQPPPRYGGSFLRKPFDSEVLLRRVTELLRGR